MSNKNLKKIWYTYLNNHNENEHDVSFLESQTIDNGWFVVIFTIFHIIDKCYIIIIILLLNINAKHFDLHINILL